jgi:hypothetical protein
LKSATIVLVCWLSVCSLVNIRLRKLHPNTPWYPQMLRRSSLRESLRLNKLPTR